MFVATDQVVYQPQLNQCRHKIQLNTGHKDMFQCFSVLQKRTLPTFMDDMLKC